jgi:hypothetical protein
MQLVFDVDGTPAEFRRSAWTGRSVLKVGDDVATVQSPFRLSTHFDFRTTTKWRQRVGGHDIEIVKVRPRVLGGLQANSFTIYVDDDVVTDMVGK